MIDIVSLVDGQDMGVRDSQTPKAANILSIQLGSLRYAESFGIDLKYFLSEEFEFQNESFKAYLIQVLANNSINVASVVETLQALFAKYTFNITPSETSSSLISR